MSKLNKFKFYTYFSEKDKRDIKNYVRLHEGNMVYYRQVKGTKRGIMECCVTLKDIVNFESFLSTKKIPIIQPEINKVVYKYHKVKNNDN